MVIVLAALIALIGSQILDGLKTKREKAALLISKLEEVSEKIEILFFEEIEKLNDEINDMIKGFLPRDYSEKGFRQANLKFKCRISSIIRIYFSETSLEAFFDELFDLYVDLCGNIQIEAIKKIIASKLNPLVKKEKAEIEAMLQVNEKKRVPCLLNIMGVISLLGKKLVRERNITFWSFSWELCERTYKFLTKNSLLQT